MALTPTLDSVTEEAPGPGHVTSPSGRDKPPSTVTPGCYCGPGYCPSQLLPSDGRLPRHYVP
ncbi:hypothetical protein J6590_004059 [Homalodisca vitripennis]|nr:hypothetical protein J6590_004059 [Homalodisca vitripennis]